MDQKPMEFESSFDINRVSFDNVSSDFEHKFKSRYREALKLMSDNRDRLMNNSGVNSLGILEKMALHMGDYDRNSNFEQSYNELLEEYSRFSET